MLKTTFENAFYNYIIEFHETRDYFECHEIMEYAWKSKSTYAKDDPEVALILLATAMYHFRRHNINGGKTTLNKAIFLLEHNYTFLNQYIEMNQLLTELKIIQSDASYRSINIPVKLMQYAQHTSFSVDDQIIHKHMMRDRSQVIANRLYALNNKNPVKDTPYDTHKTNKTK